MFSNEYLSNFTSFLYFYIIIINNLRLYIRSNDIIVFSKLTKHSGYINFSKEFICCHYNLLKKQKDSNYKMRFSDEKVSSINYVRMIRMA